MDRNPPPGPDYEKIVERWLSAWCRCDVDGVASFYTDPMEYRDPTMPGGISSMEMMKKYLALLFKKYPVQVWKEPVVMPHKREGFFTVTYSFKFGNDKMTIKGNGVDLMEFHGDKIFRNYVYLNTDSWADWLKSQG
jgi:hypothetical protein